MDEKKILRPRKCFAQSRKERQIICSQKPFAHFAALREENTFCFSEPFGTDPFNDGIGEFTRSLGYFTEVMRQSLIKNKENQAG